MSDLLTTLNQGQQAAVTATEGFIRVIAGAGAGKTKALAHRYAYLVKTGGIHPRNILCVTFTNKAAGEMKRRVRSLVGDGYDTSLITTYHGFCVRVLRADIDKLFYPKNFVILDRADQKTILEEIYDELELKLDYASFQKILQKISLSKADPAYVAAMTNPAYVYKEAPADTDARILQMYQQRQKKVFGLDFDDLVNFTFHIFATHADVLEKWQEQLHYIQVDEFQDSSNREMRLLDMLCATNGNLFVVGDPDQNIYEWRGARVEILVDFDQHYADTQTIILNQNYRSTPQILAVANSLIEKNKVRVKKDLFTQNPEGSAVVHLHAKDEMAETEWIVQQIKNVASNGRKFGDIAVLYRASFLSRYIEQALLTADIPYQIWGGVRFFDRQEVRDMLAYLRLVVFRDDISFLRVVNVPARRIGKTRTAFLRKYAEENQMSLFDALKANLDTSNFKSTGAKEFVELIERYENLVLNGGVCAMQPSQLLQKIMADSGYEALTRQRGDMERLENLAELYKTVVEYERGFGENVTVEQYLAAITMQQDEDLDDERDAVRLMTIHAAKGLEFPYVFVVGLNEGVFPSGRTLEERAQAGLEEERRLCFVAVTRAREKLFLTESEGFSHAGGAAKLPSRFLFDVDEELIMRVGNIPASLMEEMRRKVGAGFGGGSGRYKIGSRVGHPLFGDGTVTAVNEARGVYDITFDRGGKSKPIKMDFAFEKAGDSPPVDNSHTIAVNIPEQPESPVIRMAETLPSVSEAKQSSNVADNKPDHQTHNNEQNDHNALADTALHHSYRSSLTTDPSETNLWKRADIPHSGWHCIGITDLGSPIGTCGMCGQQIIRYVHHMTHPNCRNIGAGCTCAGRMEDDPENAATRERDYKNTQTRRKSFLKRKWKTSAKGNEYIKYKGYVIILLPDVYKNGNWKYRLGDSFSASYPSKDEAKLAAFDEVNMQL